MENLILASRSGQQWNITCPSEARAVLCQIVRENRVSQEERLLYEIANMNIDTGFDTFLAHGIAQIQALILTWSLRSRFDLFHNGINLTPRVND